MSDISIKRKLFIALANDQFARRKRTFGAQANVCKGCREILICDGPVSFELCDYVCSLQHDGTLIGPKRIPWERQRSKTYLISRSCLKSYLL